MADQEQGTSTRRDAGHPAGDEALFAAQTETPDAAAPEAHVEPPAAEAGAPAPSAPPPRKKGGYWQKLTLGVAILGLAAVGAGVAAVKFRDSDPRLAKIADFIDSASKNPRAAMLSLTDEAAKLFDFGAPQAPAKKLAQAAKPAAPPEAAKAPPPKSEAPAAPPKSEPAKMEPGKTEPGNELRKADPFKAEAAKPEPLKSEAAKPEPSKSEATKAEPSKPEPSKPEPAKPEPAKSDATKAEPSKPEAAKAEPAPADHAQEPSAFPLPPIREPEAQKAAESPAAVAPGASADVEGLKQRVDQLETATQETARAAREALAAAKGEEGNYLNALEGRIDELADELKKLRERLDSPKAETRLEQEPSQARQAQEDAGKAAEKVVLAEALNRALEHGRPFAREQAALAALGADPELLAALAPSAETGAPTPAQLRESFAPVAKRLYALDIPADADVTDKLLRQAGKLVRVRPVGEAKSETIADLTGRIETALSHEDLDAAAEALTKLPGNAKAESKAFEDTLNRRRAADKAAASLLAGAIDALGHGKN